MKSRITPITGRRAGFAAVAVTVLLLSAGARAQAILWETEDGWKVQMMGLISVWSGVEDFDAAKVGNTTLRQAEQTTRVITGFNPSKIEFLAFAPEYNGMKVSTYFQIATSINGAKTRRTGEQIEVRGADISIGTKYGTLSLGRNFAIFDSLSILNDTGSMRGIGYICTGPDGAGPNCGHIGTGYTWTDWTAGIRYASPRFAGLQFRIGIFDPIETAFGQPGGFAPFIGDNTPNFSLFNFSSFGTAIDTSSPLVEAELNWSHAFAGGRGTLLAWSSYVSQDVEDKPSGNDTQIQGYNFGGRTTLNVGSGVLGITGNWSETEGIAEGFLGFGVRCNVNACDAVEGSQWYANIDYTFGGKTPGYWGASNADVVTVGLSYGEGSEDANAVIGNGDVDRELLVGYIQYQVTPNLNLNIEAQHFERKTTLGMPAAGLFLPNEEYEAFMFGAEFRF